MDEPTASLDFGNQVRVLDEVTALARSGIGVLLSTHDPDQAFQCADRVALLRGGELIAQGAPRDGAYPGSPTQALRRRGGGDGGVPYGRRAAAGLPDRGWPMNDAAAEAADLAAIRALLEASGLPGSDLTPAHLDAFWIRRDAAGIVGIVGLEPRGRARSSGRLRSGPTHAVGDSGPRCWRTPNRRPARSASKRSIC